MTRRAILHIGTEKTGTTTLQHALARAREPLVEHGFRFPLLGAGHAQVALVTYAKSAGAVADLPALGGQGREETREAFDARIERELAAEVAAHPEATFILSSEHASSRLNDAVSIARLKALLDRHFQHIEVMIYLRRWDRMAISAHSTFVRNGHTEPFTFAYFRDSSYLDYAGMLARWSQAFGKDRLFVGLYDRHELRDGSIVADFCTRFALPPLNDVGKANVALNPDTVGTLVLLNRILAKRDPGMAETIRASVVRAMAQCSGTVPVSRAQAESFVAHYAAQGEEIRARYFSDRTHLFNDRFDDYPTDETPISRNWRDVSGALVDAIETMAHTVAKPKTKP